MSRAEDDFEIIRGSDNVFRDVGLPDPDSKLVKADLASAIMRAQREEGLTNASAARRAGVQEADISRIRNGDLNRFTIDRLARIARCLDPEVQVVVVRARRTGVATDRDDAAEAAPIL